MNLRNIDLLERIIAQKPSRENRLTELLRDPLAEFAEGWYMCVPACFIEALDIKQTERMINKKKTIVWTQGSSFSFKDGDVIYDTPEAYKCWTEAIKRINLCIQIDAAISAGPVRDGRNGRFSGSVTFSILLPDEGRNQVIRHGSRTMSQDEFVKFLIIGPPEDLKQKLGMD